MLNLRDDIILKEEVSERIQANHAQIRDLLNENEQLLKFSVDKTVLLTRKEASEKLRCPEMKIPRAIPRVRVGKNYLFQLSDLEDFIAVHKNRSSKS